MKRIQLEPWTPYDKLSLASAVMRTGDQNWNAVARATRNIFEESTKYMIEEKRSPEWFSNKQCAAQYEALLKNIGPRRKKKSEKSGSEHIGESPTDIIMNAVRQECIEELKRSLASTQALYLKLHKENEDIQAGNMDHKLEEMLEEYEAKEREREIKMKLKYKLGEKNPEIMENNVNVSLKSEEKDMKKTLEKETPVSEPAKANNLTTSPLLTSLLQSPSPLTRPSLPSNTSPTISLLLNSSPSVPSSDSPTLTKLLEATSTVMGSPISSLNTSTPALPVTPKQEPSINNLINSAVSATTSTPTPITTQTSDISSPAFTLTSPVPVSSKEIDTQSSNAVIASTSSSILGTKATTPDTTCASTPVVSVTSTPTSTIVTSTIDHSVASSPSISGDSEQVSEEVVIKDENASSQGNKEILEIEEIVNPSTPEVVLEDLVHTVESEVVIDQETPTSKRKNVARRLQLEQIEETETDDEVMETVEQIIEKVEEAIIETVGKEPAEIDLGHNQSSETDNLSDQIETLDLDSHAVELIVLGHNQGKVITIRHDTEISSEPSKSDPSADDVRALESFGDVENLVEEEVRTLEEELQEVEEIVGEEGEEIVGEEIKLQEEIIEHEEIVEDKGLEEEINEECEVNVVASNIELEEMKVVGEKTEEILKEEEIKEDDPKNEEVVIKIDEPLNPNPEECTVENEIICVEDIKVEGEENIDNNTEITTQDEVELEEIRNVESIDIVETKVEEAIVEEAPEEVVIAELVEEVVQAEKLQIQNINTTGKPAEKPTPSEEHNFSIKEEIVEEESLEVSTVPAEVLEVTPVLVPKIETIADSLITTVKEESRSDKVPSQEENIATVGNSVKGGGIQENKDTLRTSGRSTEKQQPSSSTIRTEAGKSIKIEKDVVKKESIAEDSKPGQETGKRRTGRKRYPLAGCAETKPNSPAPSSHSIEDDREYKAWKKSIMLVYNRLAAHKYASVFLKPITEAEASGYHSVVLRPMDLTTIKRNIETGVIRSTVEFQRDMILMAQNAMIYNKPDSLIFKMAEDMLADMMSQMEVMVQALGDGVPLWGDSDEKLLTRGRASKSQTDESAANKRRSLTDETPVRRRQQQQQQTEDSAKKRKGQQSQEEIAGNRKRSEEVKKKGSTDDISKKKSLDESTNKRKTLAEESNLKRKGQVDDSASKKKYCADETSSTRKKTQSDDTYTSSTKKKSHTDDSSSNNRKSHVDETPPTGKRKSQHVEEQSKRKTEASSSKRKAHADDTPSSSKRKSLHIEESTGSSNSGSKKKAHVDETAGNKRKRSSAAVVEEPRSTSKRKRAEAT